MIVQKFNKTLEKYSHLLTTLRLKRTALAQYTSEEVFACLLAHDAEEKGYFTPDEIIQIWLSGFTHQQQLMAFMEHSFNFEKISYSIIHNFLTGNLESPSQDPSKPSLSALLSSIFELSFRIYALQQQILLRMHHFIPMRYSTPSQEQFTRYAICQNITVDIKQISQALNLPSTHLSLPPSKAPLSFEKTLANPSVSNLQDIMKRLQSRVSSLGQQWMSPLDK